MFSAAPWVTIRAEIVKANRTCTIHLDDREGRRGGDSVITNDGASEVVWRIIQGLHAQHQRNRLSTLHQTVLEYAQRNWVCFDRDSICDVQDEEGQNTVANLKICPIPTACIMVSISLQTGRYHVSGDHSCLGMIEELGTLTDPSMPSFIDSLD